MRNRIVSGTLVSLALVLAFAAQAQADIVGINICSSDANSVVPSSLSDGPTGALTMTGWLNWNVDTNAWVGTGIDGMTLSWGYTGGNWGGVDNNGSVIPNTPNGTTNDLDYTGVGGEYGATVTVSGIPAGWGTFTAYTLGDDYGGAAGNRWDSTTGSGVSYTLPYPGGDGRSGGFIKAIQFSGPNVSTGTSATPILTVVPTSVNLGRIIKGVASPSQNIGVTESGGAATTYAVGTVSNSDFSVVDAGTTVGILASGNNTHAVTADTSTAGSKLASITVAGTAVAMDATVLEHANGTFANTTGVLSSADKVLTLNFGTVSVGTGGGNIDSFFDIYANVVGAATANLDLAGIVGDLSKLTGPSIFSGLVAGSSQGYTYSFNTSAAGTLSASYTFNLADEAGVLGGTTDTLTLNVTGRVSHPGDANSDGTVDFLDYNIVKTNYLSSGVGWTGGDLNLDGTVDFLDYNIVKTHYLHTDATIGVQAIPEPATLALLALAGLAIRRKRQG